MELTIEPFVSNVGLSLAQSQEAIRVNISNFDNLTTMKHTFNVSVEFRAHLKACH